MAFAHRINHPDFGKWLFKRPVYLEFKVTKDKLYQIWAHRDLRNPRDALLANPKNCQPVLIFQYDDVFKDAMWCDYMDEICGPYGDDESFCKAVKGIFEDVAFTGRVYRSEIAFDVDAADLDYPYEMEDC